MEFTPVLNRGWNLLWFEEPISLEHIDVLAEITHAISTPIMWVRISAYTTGSMTYWGNQATDIIMPDISKYDGLSECRRIVNIAKICYIPFVPHKTAAR